MKSYIYDMRVFRCCLLMVIATLLACGHKNIVDKSKVVNSGKERSIGRQKKDKRYIDNLLKDKSNVVVLAKIIGKDKLVKIINSKFPDEVETTFNLLIDNNSKKICALEVPFSESGDWFILYKSYFDDKGKLFAFERQANFFNSGCTKDESDAAHETLVKYYSNGKLIDSTYTLTDSKKRPLVKSKCVFNYDYPYTIIFDWDTYKKANKINIP